MLTDIILKLYAGQIAGLFCNNPLCKASVKSRIVNNLTNETFENYFLPNLDKGRFYVHHFSNFVDHGGGNIQIDTTFYDLLTNERTAGTWHYKIPVGENAFNYLVGELAKYGFNVVQGMSYGYTTYKTDHIMHKPSKQPGYGIVFVPASSGGGYQGGGTPGGGGITPTPEPVITPEPVVTTDPAPFDISKLIIPIIASAAIYFLTG